MSKVNESVRRLVRNIPGARQVYRLSQRRDEEVLQRLALYNPNSAGRVPQKLALAIEGASQVFPLLVEVLGRMGHSPLSVSPIGMFVAHPNADRIAEEFKVRLDTYGSDKGTGEHNYHKIYGQVLAELGDIASVVEVGLGTNYEDVVSNMGLSGHPGASLRAFRDQLPRATVYGADVDSRVLFDEDRIFTFFVDQTDLRTVDTFANQLPGEVDLVIDDGLHSPNANLAIVLLALNKLRAGGWLVIEDIAREVEPFWQVAGQLLNTQFDCYLVRASDSVLIFAARRRC